MVEVLRNSCLYLFFAINHQEIKVEILRIFSLHLWGRGTASRWKEFSQHLIVIGLKFSEFLRFLLKFFILSSCPHSPYTRTALARQPRISARNPSAQKQCSYRCFVLIQALKIIFLRNRIKKNERTPRRYRPFHSLVFIFRSYLIK